MSFHVPDKFRLINGPLASTSADGNNGAFVFQALGLSKMPMRAIASDSDGWEHVCVSTTSRRPTRDEMCHIKSIFWDDGDCIVQYQPTASEYVNNHRFCLHLCSQVLRDFES